MSQINNSPDSLVGLEFDYYSCMSHGVIVNDDNVKNHLSCNVVGESYIIKQYHKPKQPGLISATLVRNEREKLETIRWERNQELEKAKRIRDQDRFQFQIASGDIIINLLTMEMKNNEY